MKRPPRRSPEWKAFVAWMGQRFNFYLNADAFMTGSGARGTNQAFVRSHDQHKNHVGFQHMEISEAWKFYCEETAAKQSAI